jgi:putative peptide maturation system protein
MSTLDTPLASLPGVCVSLGQLLRSLHRQGRLRPLAVKALSARLVQQEARRAGLSVTAEELQAAADVFRRGQRLNTAAATQAWLAGRGLSVDDFEAGLEENLLAAKLKRHLSAPQVDEFFSAHRAELERVQFAILLLERDELARELASQVRDEGRDLEEVARAHGLAVARSRLFRKDLGRPLAEALAAARPGELVGPVGTPEGFALVKVEARQPAELDVALRRRIEDELFEGWLAGRMKEAAFDLASVGASG